MTVEGTIRDGGTEVVVQVVRAVSVYSFVNEFRTVSLPTPSFPISHTSRLSLSSRLPFVGIDHPLVVFLHLGTAVRLVVVLALLY